MELSRTFLPSRQDLCLSLLLLISSFAQQVTSTNVPNLTLVDLPGIVAARVAGEPDNIMEQTRSLVEKYLKMPHTLVLAVVPAFERIRNSQARTLRICIPPPLT